MLGIQNDREWARLARDVLQRPELADDPSYATNVARVGNRAAVDAAVGERIAQLTIGEAQDALDDAHIACARLNAVTDLLAHPQLVARDRWREVATPAGPVRALRSAVEPCGESPMGAVPSLGEHTEAILAELGLVLPPPAR